MSLIAANVANAQTPGYVRKTFGSRLDRRRRGGSVRVGADQPRARPISCSASSGSKSAGGAYADLRAQFLSAAAEHLRRPRAPTARSKRCSTTSPGPCSRWSTSPDSTAARSHVLSSAQVLTQTLNSLTTDIQSLRGDAESGICRFGRLRQQRDAADRRASTSSSAAIDSTNASDAALADQRDQYIDQLSQADGHPGRHRATTTRSPSSPIPASSSSARGAAQLSFNPQGTVTRGNPVERRSDQEQPSARCTLVAANGSDRRSDRQQVDPLGQDRRLSRHARQRAGAGADPARRPGRGDGAGAVGQHRRWDRRRPSGAQTGFSRRHRRAC